MTLPLSLPIDFLPDLDSEYAAYEYTTDRYSSYAVVSLNNVIWWLLLMHKVKNLTTRK